MELHIFVVLATLMFVGYVTALKCAPSACSTVLCAAPPPNCPKGYILKPGGHCLCCNVCKKILYEGGNCTSESPIGGVISDKVVCADGLICKDNICQKEC
ncbi:uncharacterized protein LOC123314523 [Coccinella septempunctata]|uniref:uncharacterized protein LOC123314523 n=1 Tax=Coccinella septempunctata TaxID=41139 RepID=UPI001D060DF4|nr:uncharacterized protein LOC123314523 [Coccinella septempunctata]